MIRFQAIPPCFPAPKRIRPAPHGYPVIPPWEGAKGVVTLKARPVLPGRGYTLVVQFTGPLEGGISTACAAHPIHIASEQT